MSESVIQSLAGSVAGMGALCITYPLVVASTRDAVTEKAKSKEVEGLNRLKSITEKSTIVRIFEQEGVSGLYSGLSSSLFGIGVTNAVYYFAYSLSSESARKRNGGNLSVGQSILAGVIAGTATTVVTNPLWVIQTHQSTYTHLHPNSPSPSIPKSVKDILAESGPEGFWRGIKAALVLVINPVLQYTAFEQLQNLLLAARRKRGMPVKKLSDIDIFVLGALAKLFATSLSYPLVLLKSRLQSNSHAYPSILSALLQILGKEGVQGLYRGMQAKLLQSVLTASLLFAGQRKVYDTVKLLLAKQV
ncbi:Predicted mitochondrial carrier protein [Phaffia rhodozyma]|uniref:Predicted mitochondrial carrier protein n=1 Tax=Phaffia rhodozyma TaxID=264483 RepID=A0A0F7SI59_PHARH|nr:Predicted mitochondrial carrier protein [Phaffia rhodozyma]